MKALFNDRMVWESYAFEELRKVTFDLIDLLKMLLLLARSGTLLDLWGPTELLTLLNSVVIYPIELKT